MHEWRMTASISDENSNYSNSNDLTPSEAITVILSPREIAIDRKRQVKLINDIWYHFTKLRDEQVMCDYCESKLKKQKHSGTNTYWDHLKRCRINLFDQAKGNKLNKRLKLTDEGITAVDPGSTYYSKQGFQQALLELFIKNSIPFNVVDNDYFRKPFFILGQDADLLSASTLKRNMMTLRRYNCSSRN